MNNKYLAVFVLLLFISQINAQTLSVSTPQLAFGNVYENAPDSLPLTITNNTGRDVTVTNIRFYVTYGVPAFSTPYTWFTIPDNTSASLWVKFSPRHNIFHNSEMVIENDGLRGDLTVDLTGQGKYSNHYYDLSENLSEENLKTTLKVITGNGYNSLGYNIARDSMFMRIDNKRLNGQGAAQNTIECVYTGRIAAGYTDRSDCQTNYSFNTEHTFPQSMFSSMEPMRSDLNHLFPTDDVANNQRGDNPFGEVVNPSWNNGGSSSDGFTFEPRDQQKGVVARALFYFVIRYQNYTNFVSPQESVLRTWYWNFLPTAADIARNSAVYSAQHNRNPFIDYPVFLERIHSVTSTSVEPLVSSLDLPVDTIIYGTIPSNTPVVYNYVIVNNGNTPVNLTGFALSNASLTFTYGGTDTTLAAGDGLNVGIRCLTSAQDSIRAFLTYQSNAAGHTNVSVPIFVNDNIFNGIKENTLSVDVYPNPASNTIFIRSNENISWKLFTLQGIILSHGTGTTIDISSNPSGVYILEFNGVKKLIVKAAY